MRTNTTEWYSLFGSNAQGNSVQERAATSDVKFVRSQDELALWNPAAKGYVFTAKEALQRFGAERLIEIWQNGSAILTSTPREPADTLRQRREELGLLEFELARYFRLDEEVIVRAESPDYTSRMADLARIAMALGLDEAILGFQPGANGDKALAVRLKAWREEGNTPATVAKMSVITWDIATQNRLQQLIHPNSNPLAGFSYSSNYGDSSYPVWRVASDLARTTRRLLGYTETEPISSLRELCHRLEIPLIHAELPDHIAGATLATGTIRGIVVNVKGNGSNVWVHRATVAHELGHLLWDPAEQLRSLVVDSREQIETIERPGTTRDRTEARANAFAVELLAPQQAIREFTGDLDINDYEAIAQAIRANMEWFGLSNTAMRYHFWHAYDHQFVLERIPFIEPQPTDEWMGQEQFTDDFFPIAGTPIERRGEFAGIVVQAQQENWLSEETAAFYLKATVEEYRNAAQQVRQLFS